jgi:ABC-type nitrate/sulfonate/bicarbonate transport system permease component
MRVGFFTGFWLMLLQVGALSLIGGLLGISAARILHSALARAAICFLRLGHWLPVFGLWAVALPLFQVGGNASDAIVMQAITFFALVPAVAFASMYHYLSARVTLDLEWRNARRDIWRGTVLIAALVVFICQRFAPYGWDWADFKLPQYNFRYEAVLLLAGTLFVLELLFRSNFERSAGKSGSIVVRELSERRSRSMLLAFVIGAVCIALWFAYDYFLFINTLIAWPAEVIVAIFNRVVTFNSFARHIGVSLGEIFAGIFLSLCVSLIICRALSLNSSIRALANYVLPLTYITLLMFHPLFFIRLGTSSHKVAAVALLTFFPLTKVLWGLRGHRFDSRLLLGVDEALPFAFIAMFWAEAMHSEAGLGFLMIAAQSALKFADAIALAMLSFVLLLSLSATIRTIRTLAGSLEL